MSGRRPGPDSTFHFRTCPLCEAICGLRLEVAGGRVVSVVGDDEDPLSKGHLCPKGVALPDIHEDPDRLRHPVRRTPTGWEKVGWEEALSEAGERLSSIQREHGTNAVAAYLGNPVVHNLSAMLTVPLFLRALRTRQRYSATSVDQLPHMLAAHLMLGHQLLLPVPDVDRTRLLLLVGTNPVASGGSLMTAPGIGHRLEALKKRGGRLVVVDPRRTETARLADEHLFIRPGTDALFLGALLGEVLAAGEKLGRLEPFTDGLAELRRAIEGLTPERAEAHAGIPAETTRRLARELRETEPAACHGRVGTSTQAFGGLCQWLLLALNAVTGNLDRRGGVLVARPAVDPLTLPRALGIGPGSFGRFRSRVRSLPEFGGELPAAALAEEILTEGKERVRGLVTVAGNPVLSTPNGRQLDRALASLDFMVAVDPYLNETTRHAHLVLPPVSPLEKGHYDLIFNLLSVRNTARYSPPLFPRPEGGREDGEILLELARRVENRREGRNAMGAFGYPFLRWLGTEGLLDLALRLGPRGAGLAPWGQGLSLAALRKAPHGVDLGPLEPSFPGRLPHGRVRLAPEPFLGDVERLRQAFPAGAAAPPPGETLLLFGRRNVRDNNTWMHNLPRLMRGKPRCTLMVHPSDARRLELVHGQEALVASRAGEVRVPVDVTSDVMPGTASLPHGYGHAREGVRLRVASTHAGESVNDVTDETLVDALCGTAAFSGVPVTVRLAPPEAQAPPRRPRA